MNESPVIEKQGKGLALAALIVGCVGLILGPLGILVGITAIILAIISLVKNIPAKGLAIGGLVAGAISIIVGIAISFLISYVVTHGVSQFSKPNPAIQTLITADKYFAQGQKARIDTIDFTVVDSKRNYTPTEAQKASCVPEFTTKRNGIAESDAQYVYVRATFERNNGTVLEKEPSYDGGVDKFQLNDEDPCFKSIKSNSAEYVYRVRKDAIALVLSNIISVYTSSTKGPFGSEGASTKSFEYKINIR